MKPLLLCLLLVLTLGSMSSQAEAEAEFEPIELPEPTGAFGVGTVTFFWTDETRLFSYSSFQGDRRRIAVQVWFPADGDGEALEAPYAPLSSDYRHVTANSKLSPSFSPAVSVAPLILISPGRGVERYGYTAIAEELASRGFVVASVDMPGIGHVIYPDGYIASPDPQFRPSRELMSGPYEKVDEFFEEPTEIGRLDLELALRNIRRLNEADPTGRFVGKIDTTKIGIFGHSLGGRIAGAFAEKNESVEAYISMEGIVPRRARLQGLDMPVAMMCSSATWPYAKDNYQTVIDGRRNEVFMVELVGFGHNSVTDFPFVTPAQFSYSIDPSRGLSSSVQIVRAFFEAYLGGRDGFVDSLGALDDVVVTKYAAP